MLAPLVLTTNPVKNGGITEEAANFADYDAVGAQQFESLAKVQQSLSFGEITKGEPILKLAAPQNSEDRKARKKIAAKKKAKPAAE